MTEFILGHVTNKSWAYSGVFSFFRKKNHEKMSPPPKSLFENRMKNPFSKRHILGQNAPQKILNSYYTALYQKTAFGFDTGPQEVPKPVNTQIRVFAYFMCLLVRALPEVRDRI